ncbi:PREDICTED: small integral membrane protein 13 [Tinamus guttatus]|uniref:small integral membrane protein 13 n=1 Tax=Tinamus guttatus TaxID=94827 RepID=UPI00052EC904|nr:PREDICTED: small integral membrane protein 13 [Tinamus guttatus]
MGLQLTEQAQGSKEGEKEPGRDARPQRGEGTRLLRLGRNGRWYVVWQLFLSKFKFLRELIGDTGSQQGDNELPEAEVDQETPPSPHRGRQKSARQRRAPAEETT